MNGLQAVFYRRPYGIVRKDNHVSGPFFNFSRRHCLRIESLAPPAARCGSEQLLPERTKARQRGQRIVSRGESRPARRLVMMTGGGGSIIGGRFRRKSAKIRMRIRMHFAFSRAKEAPMPTGSRAGARFHRRPYAAVCTVCGSLKRKKAEKGPTPKRGA